MTVWRLGELWRLGPQFHPFFFGGNKLSHQSRRRSSICSFFCYCQQQHRKKEKKRVAEPTEKVVFGPSGFGCIRARLCARVRAAYSRNGFSPEASPIRCRRRSPPHFHGVGSEWVLCIVA